MTKTARFIPAPEMERRSNEDLMKGASEFSQMMQRRRTIRDFSDRAVPKTWLDALAALGTDWKKPFLETAPWLITVFAQPFRILPDGTRIATGLLVIALHSCGLAALTHTPSPMGFLNRILGRPSHEKAFVLMVVGQPDKDAVVPDIARKSLEEISSFVI